MRLLAVRPNLPSWSVLDPAPSSHLTADSRCAVCNIPQAADVCAVLSFANCILYDKSLGTSKLNVPICHPEPCSPSWIHGTHTIVVVRNQ
jgi:hypothetical protein